jgi:predicted O-methyltransferase YrrM
MKNFTMEWNGEFIKNTSNLPKMDICLEIGCFEGLTSNYIVNQLLNENGKLICVDPLTDTYLNNDLSDFEIISNTKDFGYFKNQYERFIYNTKEEIESGKIELIRDLSFNCYESLLKKYTNKIDFIYIDGDHRAKYVYLDSVNCFKLCKINGYILFDDYLWEDINNINSTKNGIDQFLKEYEGKYQLLINNYQILIKKL